MYLARTSAWCTKTSRQLTPYVFSLAIQCNQRDNRRAVPADDGAIIRSVGVPWIFKRHRRRVRDTVVLSSAFLHGFVINLSTHCCVVSFRFQTHLIFTSTMRCESTQSVFLTSFLIQLRERTITFLLMKTNWKILFFIEIIFAPDGKKCL